MSLDGQGRAGDVRRAGVQPAGEGDRVSEIHVAILRAVMEQRLPPGTKLPEDQLAAHFGVSRTLVRGALRSLAQDGIVVLARHRGASVASPGPAEARDIFEARRLIEAVTVARAAERATLDGLTDLAGVMAAGRAALAAAERGRAIRLSGQFHIAVAGLACQPVLEGILSDLVARSSLVIALYGHRGRWDCGDHDHAGLVTALRDRDGRAAARLMDAHLRAIEADLDLERGPRAPLPLGDLLGS